MKEIHTRADIKYLVDHFYQKVIADDIIGIFFTQVIVLDWEKHIPIMYDFWESVLLGQALYKGNPMLKHIALHQQKELTKDHFNRWLTLWEETVSEHFQGKVATSAIAKAHQIAGLMMHKIENHTSGHRLL